jgi:phosphatidylserine decarboxylase
LLGCANIIWQTAFSGGDVAVFRLTPDKYHYNHTPVAGKVVDFYAIDGDYHCYNPSAVVSIATPYSKNKRVETDIRVRSLLGKACKTSKSGRHQ